VYLDDPPVAIDTNAIERALRVIPMGRKNWLFCWTELGTHQIGVIQSLLVTCKLHDIVPYDYLVDVLQRVSEHPKSKIEELTPRRWKELFASNPIRSALNRTVANGSNAVGTVTFFWRLNWRSARVGLQRFSVDSKCPVSLCVLLCVLRCIWS
jgi:IS66 C-terminal element/Transposase IS66 family